MAVARAITVAVAVAVAVAVFTAIVLADTHGRHHPLAFADIDDAYAAGGAARNANSVHRTADQRAAIGNQHDLIVVEHGERRHDRSAPTLANFGEAHQLHALTAAAGHAIFVGRGALAEARRGHGEHELLLALQFPEAVLRQRGGGGRLLRRRRGLLLAALGGILRHVLGLPQRARAAQVAFAFLRRDALAAVDQGHRDHLVALGQR